MGLMDFIARGAAPSPAAVAPMLMRAMPNAARVVAMQRASAILTERSAVLNRACGDVIAAGLAAGAGDCAPDNIASLIEAAGRAVAAAAVLQDLAQRQDLTVEAIKALYGFKPTSADVVPLKPAG